MRTMVCTGWNPDGSKQYGRRFLASFDRHWPASVELQVYVETPEPMPRAACRSLWDIPHAREVAGAMQMDERFAGTVPFERWKAKHRKEGYNFRFDARKFWKQILIPGQAAEGLGVGDVLIWLDGDVETIGAVPADFPRNLLGRNGDVAFLGRGEKHSEIGFWAIRINEATRRFLACMARFYTSGGFAHLDEWHSAYVWDQARGLVEMNEVNLTHPRAHGHVWPSSPLARYMRHDKGRRKPGGTR